MQTPPAQLTASLAGNLTPPTSLFRAAYLTCRTAIQNRCAGLSVLYRILQVFLAPCRQEQRTYFSLPKIGFSSYSSSGLLRIQK